MILYFWDPLGRVKESNFLKKLERVRQTKQVFGLMIIYHLLDPTHLQKKQKESPYRSTFGLRLAILWFISPQNNFAWWEGMKVQLCSLV